MILGTIYAVDNNKGVCLVIDGENEPTTKNYHYLASYYPHAGDRVLIEEIGDSYVVLGKLTSDYSESGAYYMKGFNITNNTIKAKYQDGTYSNAVNIVQSNSVHNSNSSYPNWPIYLWATVDTFWIRSGTNSWKKIQVTNT